MPVEMRGSLELADDDELLVHMGAGSPDTVVATALRAFHDYEGVLQGLRGAFTVSVFALPPPTCWNCSHHELGDTLTRTADFRTIQSWKGETYGDDQR